MRACEPRGKKEYTFVTRTPVLVRENDFADDATHLAGKWPPGSQARTSATKANKEYTFVPSALLLEGRRGGTAGIFSRENDFVDATKHPDGKNRQYKGLWADHSEQIFRMAASQAGSRAAY